MKKNQYTLTQDEIEYKKKAYKNWLSLDEAEKAIKDARQDLNDLIDYINSKERKKKLEDPIIVVKTENNDIK